MTTMSHRDTFENIPQPPLKPTTGNLEEINPRAVVSSLLRLAQTYGPLFKLTLPDRQWVVAANYEFINELCDEQRFIKKNILFQSVRQIIPNSIFTASTTEPIWSKAHNIMLPLFSTQAMHSYLPKMWEATMQMIIKWEHLNPDEEIDVTDNMTRLTSDIIGLCCLSYYFNSFYRETPHLIMQALMRSVENLVVHARGVPGQCGTEGQNRRQSEKDSFYLHQMVNEIIRDRRLKRTGGHNDMLDQLLTGYDRQTNEKLTGAELQDQIITLLFAGHVTTSSLLSFALYELLLHPSVLAKAYAEVDRVLGSALTQPPEPLQLSQLDYLSSIIKETLRLHPPAPFQTVRTIKDEEMLGGKYRVTAEEDLSMVVPALHRDPTVWGDRVNVFNPDRFLPEAEAKIPANAYKPFGNGVRACLGRAFALQEAPLVLGMILQHFELIDHRGYQLAVQEGVGQRPTGFKIQVRRRAHVQPVLIAVPHPTEVAPSAPPVVALSLTPAPAEEAVPLKAHHTPLYVLFGSNLGVAERLAQRIGDDARERGFTTRVGPLDQAVDRIDLRPSDCAVIIVTSSYNGNPPDNATRFYHWLQDQKRAPDTLKGVRYTVFGCGNRQWATTYQAVPTFFDQAFERIGAQRIYQRGAGDASSDFDGMFQSWYRELWPTLAQTFALEQDGQQHPTQLGPLYHLEVMQGELAPSPYVASYGAVPLTVLANRELQNQVSPSPCSTRCIELELPADMSFQAGDHLGILAHNLQEDVERVANHFGCDEQTVVRIHKNDMRCTTLPIDTHISIYTLLSTYLELHETATRSQIKRLLPYTELPAEKQYLTSLTNDDQESEQRYRHSVLEKHLTLIDLLEMHPSCDLPPGIYLELLPPMRPRYYSISSSALIAPHKCRITVGVLHEASLAGDGVYHGACSTFLSHRQEGETIYGFVQDIKSPFKHPADPARPLIMIAAGTGLAPFMGFLQERAALKAQGKQVGPSLLFFGCRHPEQDFLYQDELEQYAREGLTQLFVAFSRQQPQCKVYVQDKLLEQQELVWQFMQQGAPTFVCGNMEKMVPRVGQAYRAIYQRMLGKSAQEAEQWLEQMSAQGRYIVDIWGDA